MSDFRVAVRRTNEWDGPSMLKIYTPYVEKTHYTPDTEVPTLAEYVQRIDTYTYGRMWILTEINDQTASLVVAQLLFLEAQDPDKDIDLYINSPGGSITSGMAIYDTMNFIKCDVSTICIGMAASMGSFLLSAGAKGKRLALPNAEIMIDQPLLGGLQGQASDIKIHADHIIRVRERMNRIYAEQTGQTVEQIEKDTNRDNFLTAEEACRYGLIDRVISKREN